jgi:cytochrome c-type biogenesis protein CcmH/NrfG
MNATSSSQLETSKAIWQSSQVYMMASICLALGLGIGYLLRGSQSQSKSASAAPTAASAGQPGATQKMPTLDDMKHMADKKAEPLLQKLKTDPNNAALLIQVGGMYEATHQFQDAAGYFDKALAIDPKNVAIRAQMASCLYYSGDVDGAIAQLERSLTYNATDPNSLFNLGVIRWNGKKDAKGAVTAWQQLLKTNPDLGSDKKQQVQKLMAEVENQNKAN